MAGECPGGREDAEGGMHLAGCPLAVTLLPGVPGPKGKSRRPETQHASAPQELTFQSWNTTQLPAAGPQAGRLIERRVTDQAELTVASWWFLVCRPATRKLKDC